MEPKESELSRYVSFKPESSEKRKLFSCLTGILVPSPLFLILPVLSPSYSKCFSFVSYDSLHMTPKKHNPRRIQFSCCNYQRNKTEFSIF